MNGSVLLSAIISNFVASISLLAAGDYRLAGQLPPLANWEFSSTNYCSEYPRPQMVRTQSMMLNGSWAYCIARQVKTNAGVFSNRVVVPYPVESRLSGVKELFTERERLWYKRMFVVPPDQLGQRMLLHFEAVDWETRVWLNGRELGTRGQWLWLGTAERFCV